MARFLLIRALASLVTLFLASIVVFAMTRAVPGDVVQQMMGQVGGSEGEAVLREFFGLDKPIYVQYAEWIGNVVHGDLGVSWRQGAPVTQLVGSAFMVSLELALLVLILASLIGVPLGLVAGSRQGGFADSLIQTFNVISLATPVFWVGLMLLFAVSTFFHWSPPTIYASPTRSLSENLTIMALPILSLAFLQVAAYAQFVRQQVVDAFEQDWVRAARARGVPMSRILRRHVMPNILVPLSTFMGLILIQIIGGVVIIESIFGLPGLGRLLINALNARDFPVVQGALLAVLVSAILVNFVVDCLYRVVDPRLRT